MTLYLRSTSSTGLNGVSEGKSRHNHCNFFILQLPEKRLFRLDNNLFLTFSVSEEKDEIEMDRD